MAVGVLPTPTAAAVLHRCGCRHQAVARPSHYCSPERPSLDDGSYRERTEDLSLQSIA
jgi:hypothetical protein